MTTPEEDATVRLGQLALERGLITAEQLRTALAEQARGHSQGQAPRPLETVLLEKGYLRKEQLDALMDRKPGTPAALGKYRIVRELGRGGMGVVYEATDTDLHRRVALKMLLSGPSADPGEARMEEERFLREARLSANLAKHPHIVSVYEAGVIEGRRYLAMELIDGLPLSKWRRTGSITIRNQVKVLRDVAAAVHHAHRQDVIHRDLKPDNILIDLQGQPHVMDFGLAKSVGQNVRISLTASGMIVGTPAYMSPEQAMGEKKLDHRTDVYAIGVMLYETLTGRLPFTGETAIEILMKASKNPVPPPSSVVKPGTNPTLDRTIENICLKALAKQPRDRYATAESLANDLTRWLKGDDVRVAAPAPPRRRIVPTPRTPKAWIFATAALALVALGALLFRPTPPAAAPDVRGPDREEQERRREKKRQIDRMLEEARALLRNGKLAEARGAFDEVLRKDHSNADAIAGKEAVRAREIEFELAQADLLLKDGKFREAFRAYGLVSARDAANRRAAAGVEESQKRMEEAIAQAKEREVQAKSDQERQEAERRRKEEEAANLKAREQVKEARAPADRSIRTLPGHDSAVWALAFSPDGKLLASGSVDTYIQLWDVRTLSLSRRIHEGSGIFGLSFGKAIASADVDGTVKFWDPAAGKELRAFRGHQKSVHRLVFSPDGTLVASASADGTIKLWDAEKGTVRHTFEGVKDKVYVLPVFLSKGKVLATGTGSTIRFWDVQSGKEARPPLSHEGLSAMAVNPDGTLFVTTGWNRRINLWEMATGKALRECESHEGGTWAIAFSPDGRFLASAGGDKTVKLWSVESLKNLETLVGHKGGVLAIAYQPDGRLLASGDADGQVKLWSVETLAPGDAWSKAIDLLPLVDPKRDTLSGTWKKENGLLVSLPSNNACLRLPYEAPEEYDFRVVYTRREGKCATAQFFTHQGRAGLWDMNLQGVGFSDVGGKPVGENGTRVAFPIVSNARYESVVQVRRDGVRGWIDGRKMSEWVPSMGALTTPAGWGMDVPGVLGLGNCETTTTFERVQVLEVTGKGRVRTVAVGAPPASGLLVHWKLNEGTGLAAADASGNRLSGKLMGGATWNKGKSGGVTLDGAKHWIEFPALDRLRDGSYSVALWFKPEPPPAGPENPGYLLVQMPWFSLTYLSRHHFMMQHVLAGGRFGTAMAPEKSAPPGIYHHVAATVDRTGGQTLLYVDGKPEAQGSWPPNSAPGNLWPGRWAVGGDAGRSGAKGTVDSVRVYQRVLSAAEIEALYRSELPLHDK